jgi:uncharacterized protein
MPTKITISIKNISLEAELFDTACARAIADILPIETTPNEWGDEFYFKIAVMRPLDETATTKMKAGDIGFWPTGNALAIFFGPTPMSTGADPVPASAVNFVGKIRGNVAELKKTKGAKSIRIEKSQPDIVMG